MSTHFELGLAEDEMPPKDQKEKERLSYLYGGDSASNADSIWKGIKEHGSTKFDMSLSGYLSEPNGYRINQLPVISLPLPKENDWDDDILAELNDTLLGKCIKANFQPGFDQLFVKKSKGLDIHIKSKAGISPFFRAAIIDNDHFVSTLLKEDPHLVDVLERQESVISASVRRPSVLSMLKKGNASFSNADDEKRFADFFKGKTKANNKPIPVTFFGPLSAVNFLCSKGAKVSTRNFFGISPLEMLRNPKEIPDEDLQKTLDEMFPIVAKQENAGKVCGDEDEGTFFVRTSPVTLTSTGHFQFTAKAYDEKRTQEQVVQFTFNPKAKLIPTLSDLEKAEDRVKVAKDAMHEATEKMHSASVMSEEGRIKLNAGFKQIADLNDAKATIWEIKEQHEKERASNVDFKARMMIEQKLLYEGLADADERARHVQKRTDTINADLKRLKEDSEKFNAYILQAVESALRASLDAKSLADRAIIEVGDLKVTVQRVGDLTLIMYDELYEPQATIKMGIAQLKQISHEVHRFNRMTSNGMLTTMTRARVGMTPDATDVTSTAGKILGTVADSSFFGKVVSTLGDFVSFAPVLPGLLKLAGKGLEAYSDNKKKKKTDGAVNTTPVRQEEFCINLALKLSQKLQTELSYIPTEKMADKLAVYAQLLVFAEMSKCNGKDDPDTAQFVDNLVDDLVKNIRNSDEKHYKVFREELAKMKNQKGNTMLPGLTAHKAGYIAAAGVAATTLASKNGRAVLSKVAGAVL
jgi:hypothetical protein